MAVISTYSVRLKPELARRALRARGLSLAEAARRIGCSRTTLNTLAAGKPVASETADRFGKLLARTPELLIVSMFDDDQPGERMAG